MSSVAPVAENAKSGTSHQYIPSLDGMRAYAVASVFLAHAHIVNIFPGGYGVTVFFFLSGFLITTLLRKELDASGSISIQNFYMRRLFRITPPLVITLLVAALLAKAGLTRGDVSIPVLLGQMFFLGNFIKYYELPYVDGTGVVWSLAVEEHFYLIYPLVFLVFARRYNIAKLSFLLKILCLVVLAWRMILVFYYNVSDERITYLTDTRIDSIMFGCILAIDYNPVLDKQRNTFLRSNMLFYFSIIVTVFSLLIRDHYFQDTIRYTIQGIALFPLFSVAICNPEHVLIKPLNWAAVRFIGVISYTLYLVHFVALKCVEFNFPSLSPTLVLIFAVVLSLVYSYAMYRVVEKPLASLRKRYR